MTNHLYDALLQDAVPSRQFAELSDGRNYRYQDVLDVSARFAHTLVKLGVKPGDRVAAQVPKSIEALMLYLASVRCGAVFLPLNTSYTATEISYFLNDAQPVLFVCDPAAATQYQSLAEQHKLKLETLGVWRPDQENESTFLQQAEAAETQFNTIARAAEDLAAILYTSGTTGRSKGAMLTHENLLSNAKALVEYWRFTADDVLLHALPIYHTHGLFVASNTALLSNSSLIYQNSFDVDAILRQLPNATCLMGVPTFYTRLLDDPRLDKQLVAHIRVFISGSAPLLAETHKEFESRTGHRILERYGMTETSMNTSNPYDGERRAGTVGFALPGVELRIVNPEDGAAKADGQPGSIEIKGPNVFAGYWQMPEKTAEEFRDDGFFITGDLGTIDKDGYICIVGRSKDVIISGGFNVYPKEIELLLDEQPGVQESAVIGVPDSDFGEAVIAIVVPTPDTAPEIEPINQKLKHQLARFKQPKEIFIAESLPRNTMGKVQKNKLREIYSQRVNKS